MTQSKKTVTETNYLCPKCRQRYMAKDGYRVNADKSRTPRFSCKMTTPEGTHTYCYTTTNPTGPVRGFGKSVIQARGRRFARKLDSQLYFISSAQNATPVHDGFFDAITKAWMKDTGGELVVLTMRYKNPTSRWTDSAKNAEYWLVDDKYLYNQRKKLNKNLVLVGDIKVRPTAGDPLFGMESITHGESGIFAHTKLRLTTIATPQNKSPKVLTTTGAITVPNYTDSGAGKKGEFHHVQGGVIVEIVDGKKFHLHHINCRKDGAFIWHDKAYYPDGEVRRAPACEAIVFGDTHHRFADPRCVEATFEKGGLVDVLNPKALVWHDLLDAYAVNVHHRGNPFIKIAKRKANFHVIEDEVRSAIDFLKVRGKGRKNFIIPSNHDDMLSRWIIKDDWKKDIATENIEFYLETALQMARSAKMTDIGASYVDAFGYWVNQLKGNSDITPLKLNSSLTFAEIECALHGHQGTNGARGSIKGFGAIGVKCITGHGHSPAIWNGHYRGGTMTRPSAEYTTGPGSWLQTHTSIDGFGKRHLHTCIGGAFWA